MPLVRISQEANNSFLWTHFLSAFSPGLGHREEEMMKERSETEIRQGVQIREGVQMRILCLCREFFPHFVKLGHLKVKVWGGVVGVV